jgi:hypothetical protein
MNRLLEELKATYDHDALAGFLFTLLIIAGCAIIAGLAKVLI